MAAGTVARTAHFAMHRCGLPLAEQQFAASGVALPALFPAEACIWMGAMVPKRWAKRAVTRNAIKRQIYQVSMECAPHLLQAAHVVRLRAGFDRQQFVSASSVLLKSAVRAELLQLFARAYPLGQPTQLAQP